MEFIYNERLNTSSCRNFELFNYAYAIRVAFAHASFAASQKEFITLQYYDLFVVYKIPITSRI